VADQPETIKRQAVFGGADGTVLIVGLIATLGLHHPGAVIPAALGAGLAELCGMSSGAWLSGTGIRPALANGGAACGACILPALPYAVTSGAPAVLASAVLVVIVAGVISWLRPEKGVLAWVQTFAVLAIAAAVCLGASLL
jgi:hypothetical protein